MKKLKILSTYIGDKKELLDHIDSFMTNRCDRVELVIGVPEINKDPDIDRLIEDLPEGVRIVMTKSHVQKQSYIELLDSIAGELGEESEKSSITFSITSDLFSQFSDVDINNLCDGDCTIYQISTLTNDPKLHTHEKGFISFGDLLYGRSVKYGVVISGDHFELLNDVFGCFGGPDFIPESILVSIAPITKFIIGHTRDVFIYNRDKDSFELDKRANRDEVAFNSECILDYFLNDFVRLDSVTLHNSILDLLIYSKDYVSNLGKGSIFAKYKDTIINPMIEFYFMKILQSK